ncbi:hypothetical protein SAMN05428962_2689 [Paenibacillus sp. BC26]|nr:hypothetical protein SAMN05428962_2689 [Paenibacillus sp. BC26]
MDIQLNMGRILVFSLILILFVASIVYHVRKSKK